MFAGLSPKHAKSINERRNMLLIFWILTKAGLSFGLPRDNNIYFKKIPILFLHRCIYSWRFTTKTLARISFERKYTHKPWECLVQEARSKKLGLVLSLSASEGCWACSLLIFFPSFSYSSYGRSISKSLDPHIRLSATSHCTHNYEPYKSI